MRGESYTKGLTSITHKEMVLPLLQTVIIIFFGFTFWVWLMAFIEGNMDLPPKLKEHFLLMTAHEVLTLVFILGGSESKIFLKFSYEGNCVEVDFFNRSLDTGE